MRVNRSFFGIVRADLIVAATLFFLALLFVFSGDVVELVKKDGLPAGWPAALVAAVALVYTHRTVKNQLLTSCMQARTSLRNQMLHDLRKDGAVMVDSFLLSMQLILDEYNLRAANPKPSDAKIESVLSASDKSAAAFREAAYRIRLCLDLSIPAHSALDDVITSIMLRLNEAYGELMDGRDPSKALPEVSLGNRLIERLQDVIKYEYSSLTSIEHIQA